VLTVNVQLAADAGAVGPVYEIGGHRRPRVVHPGPTTSHLLVPLSELTANIWLLPGLRP
jgi:hypothetical protein